MEGFIGAVVAVAMSFGYTEIKLRKHQKEYKELVERVTTMEQSMGRTVVAAMMPMAKSIKEIKETVGM